MRQPPRKLSVDGPHLNNDVFNVKIFLDGVTQKGCVSYDADEGWVERYKMTAIGGPLTRGGEFVTEKVHGTVTVAWIKKEAVHDEKPIDRTGDLNDEPDTPRGAELDGDCA